MSQSIFQVILFQNLPVQFTGFNTLANIDIQKSQCTPNHWYTMVSLGDSKSIQTETAQTHTEIILVYSLKCKRALQLKLIPMNTESKW